MAAVHSQRCITHLASFKPHSTASYRTTPSLLHLHIRRHSAPMASSTDAAGVPAAENSETTSDVLVQYVVLRRDLIDTWPLGSVVTQGCHASVAAIWSHKDDPYTIDYCSPTNLDSMHKVTLEVKGEVQLKNLSEKLTSNDIGHKLWIEQPENTPTCLASKPYPKSVVSMFFKKLKLFCLCRLSYQKRRKETADWGPILIGVVLFLLLQAFGVRELRSASYFSGRLATWTFPTDWQPQLFRPILIGVVLFRQIGNLDSSFGYLETASLRSSGASISESVFIDSICPDLSWSTEDRQGEKQGIISQRVIKLQSCPFYSF